jgi:hypothetical protein
MAAVKKLLGAYLAAAALAVVVQVMGDSAFSGSYDTGMVWNVVNWFMAAGATVALIASVLRKFSLHASRTEGGVTRDYLETNLIFYASIFLALLFFWNWFDSLATGPGGQSDTRMIWWAFINPLFVLVTGSAGCRLWRGDSH